MDQQSIENQSIMDSSTSSSRSRTRIRGGHAAAVHPPQQQRGGGFSSLFGSHNTGSSSNTASGNSSRSNTPQNQNHHLKDEDATYWPKGFTNIGNSCYANATLQCLMSTALVDALLDPQTIPVFRKYSSNPNLLAMGSGSVDSEEDDIVIRTDQTSPTMEEGAVSPKQLKKKQAKKECQREQFRKERERSKMQENCEWLTQELTKITEDYLTESPPVEPPRVGWGWGSMKVAPSPTSSSSNGVVNPQSITRHPDRLSPCLVPYQQEDAHEFLRALLSTLVMNGQNKQLSSLFDGLLESSVTCQKCGRASLTRDRYMDLSLDINEPDISTLEDALYEYTRTETLDSENKVYCQRCEKKQTASKGLRLATAPSILVCHLKRFAFDHYGRLVRLHKKIQFPMQLEIDEYMSELNKARPPPYDLVGLLVHQGQTCASGHYLAYVKKDGEWFMCNDSIVTKVDEETVLNQQAYIMMYEVSEMREQTTVNSPIASQSLRKRPAGSSQGMCASPEHDDPLMGPETISTREDAPSKASTHDSSSQQSVSRRLFQYLADAEGGLNSFMSDLCCGACVHKEPKEHRVRAHRRPRRKQPRVYRDDYKNYEANLGEGGLRRTLSSETVSVIEGDWSKTTKEHRSQTAPRQRVRSYSGAPDPSLAVISPRSDHSPIATTSKSERVTSVRSKKRHSRRSRKYERGRSMQVHSSSTGELPPLPTPGSTSTHRAKSSSAPRKKAYLI